MMKKFTLCSTPSIYRSRLSRLVRSGFHNDFGSTEDKNAHRILNSPIAVESHAVQCNVFRNQVGAFITVNFIGSYEYNLHKYQQ